MMIKADIVDFASNPQLKKKSRENLKIYTFSKYVKVWGKIKLYVSNSCSAPKVNFPI